MKNVRMYEPKPIETEPLKRTILVHGAMYYKCEECGKIHLMWLEKGLEDREQDKEHPELHKPVPFCVACTCGGTATHFLWQSDIHLDGYQELAENESYFENSPDEDCGKPHLRTSERKKKQERDKTLSDLLIEEFKHTEIQGFDKNEEQIKSDERSPVTQGLEGYTTSQLKAEIRRRKRW